MEIEQVFFLNARKCFKNVEDPYKGVCVCVSDTLTAPACIEAVKLTGTNTGNICTGSPRPPVGTAAARYRGRRHDEEPGR